MKKAVINSEGVCENIIVAKDGYEIHGKNLVDASGARIGWAYENGEFISPETADEIKSRLLRSVNSRRDFLLRLYEYNGHNYQIDLESQKNMIAVQLQMQMGVKNAHGGAWRDVDNVAVNMTDAEAAAFFQAVFAYIHAVKKSSWTHKENIDNLTKKEELNSYDISTGWP